MLWKKKLENSNEKTSSFFKLKIMVFSVCHKIKAKLHIVSFVWIFYKMTNGKNL
jgi:hypothetical protein